VLNGLVAKFAPDHLKTIAAVRRTLRKRLPTAHELVYEYKTWFVVSYSPSERGYEGVLALRGDTKGVRLYFTRGRQLTDPARVLRGSAEARWVNIESAATLARPEVAHLIEAAIALNTVPFERNGRGAVILRSAGAKK
jgi:hypothetical protein